MAHLQAAGMRSLANPGNAVGLSDPRTFNPITGQQGDYYYANMHNRQGGNLRNSEKLPTDATPAEKKAHLQKLMEAGDNFSYFGREGGGAPIYGRHPVRRGVLQNSREFPIGAMRDGQFVETSPKPVIQETKSVPNLNVQSFVQTQHPEVVVPTIETRSPIHNQPINLTVNHEPVYTEPKPIMQEVGRMVVTPRNDYVPEASKTVAKVTLSETESLQKQMRQDEYKRILELQVEQRRMEKEREKQQKLLEEQREQERLRREQQELENQYRREQEEKQRKIEAMRVQNMQLFEEAKRAQEEAAALKRANLRKNVKADPIDDPMERTVKPERGRRPRDDFDIPKETKRQTPVRNHSEMVGNRNTVSAPGQDFEGKINEIRKEFNEGQQALSSQIQELIRETKEQRSEVALAKEETKSMLDKATRLQRSRTFQQEDQADRSRAKKKVPSEKSVDRVVLREVATQFEENQNPLHDQSVQAMGLTMTEANRSMASAKVANAAINTSNHELFEPRIIQTNTHFVPIVDPNEVESKVDDTLMSGPNVMFTSNSTNLKHIEHLVTPRAPQSKQSGTTFKNKVRKISSVNSRRREIAEEGAMTERSNVRRNIASAGEASEIDIDDFSADFDVAYIYNKNRQRFKHLRSAPKHKTSKDSDEMRRFVKGYLRKEAEGDFSVIEDKKLAQMMRTKKYRKAAALSHVTPIAETSIIHEIPRAGDYNQFDEESHEMNDIDESTTLVMPTHGRSVSHGTEVTHLRAKIEDNELGCRMMSSADETAAESLSTVSEDSFIQTVNQKLERGHHHHHHEEETVSSSRTVRTPRYARFQNHQRDFTMSSTTEEDIPYGDTKITDGTLSSATQLI